MPHSSFLTSILGAGVLEVVSQGASSISFNWWLRAQNVNNFSVVLISDIFIACVFLLVAIFLVSRLVRAWNTSLVERVASIRVTSQKQKEEEQQGQPADDEKESSSVADGSEQHTAALLAAHQHHEQQEEHAEHTVFDFDAVSISFHEAWWMVRRLFLPDKTTIFWLFLAAVADTLHSLCETYAAGRITVLSQLFLKAAEPFLVWLLALRWREQETAKRNSVRGASSESAAAAAGAAGGGTSFTRHCVNSTPRYTTAHQIQSNGNGHGAGAGDDDENDHNNRTRSVQRTVSIDVPFSERFCELCSCCCNCSVSNLRLILSLISLVCVAAGIACHFVLEIKKEQDSKAAQKKESPAGYLVMYCFSVAGSALYTVAFGRYIFLARRVSAHSDPLDMIDYLRAVEHKSLTEHQVSVVGGVSNRSFQHSSRDAAEEQQQRQQSEHGDGYETLSAAAAAGEEPAASHRQHSEPSLRGDENFSLGSPAVAAAALSHPRQHRVDSSPQQQHQQRVLDLADDPRDMDIGYNRRSSLTSVDHQPMFLDHHDDDDDQQQQQDYHGVDGGAMAWGERVNDNGAGFGPSPGHGGGGGGRRSSVGAAAAHSSTAAAVSHPTSPSLGPQSPVYEDDVVSSRRSVGHMSVATHSTVAGIFGNNNRRDAAAAFGGSSGGGGGGGGGAHASATVESREDDNEALAILEENRSPIAPTNTDVRLVACALETLLALVFSVLVAPAFEFIPGDTGITSTSTTVNGTATTTYESVTSFSDFINNTATGIDALGSPSTLLPAGVTLAGWTFVYVADSILNHLNAPLSSLINQLGTPATAIFLYIVPALDPSGDPSDKFPKTALAVQVGLAVASVLLLLVGSLMMYVAERSGPTRKITTLD